MNEKKKKKKKKKKSQEDRFTNLIKMKILTEH